MIRPLGPCGLPEVLDSLLVCEVARAVGAHHPVLLRQSRARPCYFLDQRELVPLRVCPPSRASAPPPHYTRMPSAIALPNATPPTHTPHTLHLPSNPTHSKRNPGMVATRRQEIWRGWEAFPRRGGDLGLTDEAAVVRGAAGFDGCRHVWGIRASLVRAPARPAIPHHSTSLLDPVPLTITISALHYWIQCRPLLHHPQGSHPGWRLRLGVTAERNSG